MRENRANGHAPMHDRPAWGGRAPSDRRMHLKSGLLAPEPHARRPRGRTQIRGHALIAASAAAAAAAATAKPKGGGDRLPDALRSHPVDQPRVAGCDAAPAAAAAAAAVSAAEEASDAVQLSVDAAAAAAAAQGVVSSCSSGEQRCASSVQPRVERV